MANERETQFWTPGPWVVDRNPDQRTGTHIRASVPTVSGAVKGVSVARITVANNDDRANAALISAAPDLYEALYGLAYGPSPLMEPAEYTKNVRAARSALAKARGEQP